MKQTCPDCGTILEVNEREHKPNEKVLVECPLCSAKVEFHIPQIQSEIKVKEKIVIKEVTSEASKRKEEELKKKVDELTKENASIKSGLTQKSSSYKGVIATIVIVATIALIVGGIFYYYNILIPRKRDAAAPRYYTIATSVNLRSSRSAGGNYNKIEELPYGTALITYEVDSEWLTVKTEKVSDNSEQQEGYVSSMHTLNKHDFFILNSIWGDAESKQVINTTKCRKALLNYFKEHGYIGAVSNEDREAAGINIVPNVANQWQVFSKSKNSTSNTTYFKRLIDPESKFTDFAVIIKNINTEERKLLYFYFKDDETPILYREIDAPKTGYIKKIKLSQNDFVIDYVY